MSRPPVYELRNVKQHYQGREVLSLDHFEIEANSIVGLAGPNGSGKSTLLRILALLEAPSMGKIRFKGAPVQNLKRNQRRKVALLPQEALLLKRSVFQNVAYGLKLRKDTENLTERVQKALSLVGLELSDYGRRSWKQLSGGEAQRVALAARLILKPKVLLLDEPTASLDSASAALVLEAALRAQEKSGATLVVASHDLIWLNSLTNQVLNLDRGKIMGQGPLTILPGPWHESEIPGYLCLPLSEDQVILAAAPGQYALPQTVAGIDPAKISLPRFHRPDPPPLNLIKARVTQLSIGRDPDDLLIQLQVGHLFFNLPLDQKNLTPGTRPGSKVWISFKAEDVIFFR
ncbi:energy-coupling factor ABC transporter ATP-binding protein [Dethiosulfatarculus sandiegensis]|uniref:ABC transporter domain-containing protein n=1 Tax=Dethiosulfatarculus sandiegensis TaxID=1429043 RepID=A0A0D2JQS3_9BACT|nr:ABC transporter ATP-binding protein [Dethiosulfatarculus sandiegensis]KIX11855.1 hypothetical protein X474_22070 [Dethiosulfatarculus sandiegensis]